MSYLFVDTSQIDDKVRTVQKAAQKAINVGNAVSANSGLLYNSMFNGTGYHSSVNNLVRNSNNQCERAKSLMAVLDNAGNLYHDCEKNLKNDFDSFDKYTVGLENQIREYLGIDKIKTVDGQRASNVAKVIVGVCVIAAGAAVVSALGVAAVGTFVVKAAAGATISVVMSGTEEYLNGGSFIDGACDGFLHGSISSSVSCGIDSCLKLERFADVSKVATKTLGAVGSSGVSSTIKAIDGKNVTFTEVLFDVGASSASALVGEASDGIADAIVDSSPEVFVKKSQKQLVKFTCNTFSSSTLSLTLKPDSVVDSPKEILTNAVNIYVLPDD